jgi:hypothetical protein
MPFLLAQPISGGRAAGGALRRFLLCGRLCLRFCRRALRGGALGRGATRRLSPAIGCGFGSAADRTAAFAFRLLRREQRIAASSVKSFGSAPFGNEAMTPSWLT